MKIKTIFFLMLVLFLFIFVSTAQVQSKSLYLIADHHTLQFDAWDINNFGIAQYQFKVNLQYASSPSDIAIDESSNTIFISSEFGTTVEMVNATTMVLLGEYVQSGMYDMGGVEVNDETNLVYIVKRQANTLYVFYWNETTNTLTQQGSTITLQNCHPSGAMGIALDEYAELLWVADGYSGKARAYDINTWNEVMNFTPVHHPIDIAVDRLRGYVYTVSMTFGAGTPPGAGSNLLSKYNLATDIETTGLLPCQGVGVAVDELTGYVYLTLSPYCDGQGKLLGYDTSTTQWNQIMSNNTTGSPAGICIPQKEVSFNPLNLTKNDGLEGNCVQPGDTIDYTISYDNMRNNLDVHNVSITDYLPNEVTFLAASNGGIYNQSTHTVNWYLGTLPADMPTQQVQLTVGVNDLPNASINITNSVTIHGDEPGYTGPTTINTITCAIDTPDQHNAAVPLFSSIGFLVLVGMMLMIASVQLKKIKK